MSRRVLFACCLWLAWGCAPGEPAAPEGPPHVVLVTVDTLRPDRLSAYGFEGHETPHIDALASEGVLFENAFTDTPWTTPSMSSVLTGTWPTLHGFKSTNTDRLGLEQETLAELLRDRGYATAAIIGSFPLDSIYRLDQGFDVYDDAFTRPIWRYPGHEPTPKASEFLDDPEAQAMFALLKAMSDSRRADEEVTDAALAWLDTRPEKPFFLWVHYFGPHTKPDWTVPESERLRQQYAQYDPDVRTVDRELGRLLARLDAEGLAQRTLVIFHADHAESLGEQGYVGHGVLLNDATMRIPLILRYPPRVRGPQRVASQVRNVDIFPTVLDAVGAPVPQRASGISLLPLSEGGDVAHEARPAYMETWYTAHRAFAPPVRGPDAKEYAIGRIHRAVREGSWQLIRTEPHPLLDVTDPEWEAVPLEAKESVRSEVLIDTRDRASSPRDLSAAHPEVAARLRALLDVRIAEEGARAPPCPSTRRRSGASRAWATAALHPTRRQRAAHAAPQGLLGLGSGS
jgi:arylsulfatase A-like enzyme